LPNNFKNPARQSASWSVHRSVVFSKSFPYPFCFKYKISISGRMKKIKNKNGCL